MNRSNPAILAIFGSLSMATSTPGAATNLDTMNYWLTVGSAGYKWQECPTVSTWQNGVPGAANPYFAYNNGSKLNGGIPKGSCEQIGPFRSRGSEISHHNWWVQVITNLRPTGCTDDNCLADLIRVCSQDYVHNPSIPSPQTPGPAGPCGSSKGVGWLGCEVCAVPNTQ